ncbi:hypothetical protein JZO67_002412 [Enterococcus sp. 665A]|uniref:Uncharacterized protein n=1 Tax=Candidatus Enterococcus ferrettii TaxID=2815324 RepID=A0ABV0EPA6_9ENTE
MAVKLQLLVVATDFSILVKRFTPYSYFLFLIDYNSIYLILFPVKKIANIQFIKKHHDSD